MSQNKGYDSYMNSARWRARRNRAVKRAGTRCEYVDSQGKRCWAHSRLHVHHLTYENFGKEKAKDLQVLCEDHHAAEELVKTGKFASIDLALTFWKIYKRKHPKDWVCALEAAKAAAKGDKGRTA
jgi:hypothetical protein